MPETFEGCTALTTITLPEHLNSISESAFYGCSSLTSIILPKGMVEIGLGAFNGCSSLTNIEIPESVTSISESAFAQCYSLTEVYSMSLTPPNFPNGKQWVFDDETYHAATLYVPESAIESYKAADGWSKFMKIVGITPNGIEKIMSESEKEQKIYDIQGRRLHNLQRGLNIVNGRKVLVR